MSEQSPQNAPAPTVEIDPLATTVLPELSPSEARRGAAEQFRFMLVVIIGVTALFLAFLIFIAFGSGADGVVALAVIAAPIVTIVAAYYGITLAIGQVRSARSAADLAEERALAAEASARESDAWAAQMESGLRLAVSKLTTAGISTRDVERAAGTPDEFF
jgi:hypothetical protein